MSKLKLSKSSQNLRKKWQADADKRGGGKIVLTQNDAMEVVKKLLADSFKPMSITEIYEVSFNCKSLFFAHCTFKAKPQMRFLCF